jgi:hypothetical protein
MVIVESTVRHKYLFLSGSGFNDFVDPDLKIRFRIRNSDPGAGIQEKK